MVSGAPRLRDIEDAIRSLIDDDHLVVAYNARFDLGMLISLGVIDGIPRNVFDVMREYALVHGASRAQGRPGYRWSRLEDCARYYGYNFRPHDALGDARATAYCFKALLNDPAYA